MSKENAVSDTANQPGGTTPPASPVPPTPPAPPAGVPPYASGAYGTQPPAYGQAPAYGTQPSAPGYAPPPTYAAPGYAPTGYGVRTNTMAIISLIASIAGLSLIPFIGSLVGTILGHMSLKQLRTSGEAGRGLALAGTIVGWVGLGFYILVFGFILLSWVFVAAAGFGTSLS